ncbi:hypothetical protein [Thalassotalea sp. ND16A]|uniref:hypothetical protein n=1 Tax=Thalassotalea sp. ND16A TaxID=1535422 RepID=UPI00051A4D87|nr:hypothetical protein [Thalassotalea sp. ND16A]KGK00165.1 hypothetical protein ND16A_3636 [Thalassotalea sp. ND16A]
MLKPFTEQGEFIHSFIFRMQDTTGFKDFSNIVSTTGRWKEYIYIHKNTGFIFERHNESDLIQLLRNTGFDKKYTVQGRAQELTKPTKYLEDLQKLINPTSKPRGLMIPNFMSREVRFCKSCMNEFIKEYGTGFFKGHWQVSKYCNTHQIPLLLLKASAKNTSIQNIRRIIRGELLNEVQEFELKEEDLFVSPQLFA